MKLISVKDTKADAYLNPVVVRTTAEGLRMFEAQTNDKSTMSHKHPSDFILCELADWDEISGTISTYDSPKILAVGTDFIQ